MKRKHECQRKHAEREYQKHQKLLQQKQMDLMEINEIIKQKKQHVSISCFENYLTPQIIKKYFFPKLEVSH